MKKLEYEKNVQKNEIFMILTFGFYLIRYFNLSLLNREMKLDSPFMSFTLEVRHCKESFGEF